MYQIHISKRTLLRNYAIVLTLWFIIGLSVGLTQMCKPPSISEPILTMWGFDYTNDGLITNINGDVGEIRWRTKGDVALASYCAIEHENQIYILGHRVLFNFTCFETLNSQIKL